MQARAAAWAMAAWLCTALVPGARAAPGDLVPANGAPAAHQDTRLQLRFDAPPEIGTAGQIRVYRGDGALVDTIDIGGAAVYAGGETQARYAPANTEIDRIGNRVPHLRQWRFVHYRPITVQGRIATIQLHDNVLDWGTGYTVTIDDGVLRGRRGGAEFRGIAGGGWRFTTRAAPASPIAVTVDDDGPADFRTVQGALNWQMTQGCTTCPHAAADKSILIRRGTYSGMLFLRDVNRLTIRGESRGGTVVRAENWDAFNPGTGASRPQPGTALSPIGRDPALGTRRVLGGGRSVLLVEDSDALRLTRFTLQNGHVKEAGAASQAEALYFNASTRDGSRLAATAMNFLSTQDTVQVKGWVWIYDSLIAGDVDFVWGSPYAMLIEASEIRTIADTVQPELGGYVFQSRAVRGYPGFVVLRSRLTAGPGVPKGATYLARSAGRARAAGFCTAAPTGWPLVDANLFCDAIAYIDTRMGAHIAPAGWFVTPPPNLAPGAHEGWREWGSRAADGSPLSLERRDPQGGTADLSALATRGGVFRQWNDGAGWTPQP